MSTNSPRATEQRAPSPLARPLWIQVVVSARIELGEVCSAAVRELMRPSGHSATPPQEQHLQRAARLLAALGLPLAEPRVATEGPVRLMPGSIGNNIAVQIDAVASDRAVISTWQPPRVQLPGTSVVLAHAGLVHGRAQGALEACTRWIEHVSHLAGELAASPFEATILGWPAGQGGGAHIVERYIAAGPDAQAHARETARQRQAALEAARGLLRRPEISAADRAHVQDLLAGRGVAIGQAAAQEESGRGLERPDDVGAELATERG